MKILDISIMYRRNIKRNNAFLSVCIKCLIVDKDFCYLFYSDTYTNRAVDDKSHVLVTTRICIYLS